MEEHEDIFDEMARKSEPASEYIDLHYLKVEKIKVRKIAEYEPYGFLKMLILEMLGIKVKKLTHYCLDMWVLNPYIIRPGTLLVDENQVKWYAVIVEDDYVEAHNVDLIQGEVKVPEKDLVCAGSAFCTN